MMNTAAILVLLFLAITFLQSGYDKVADWSGNVGWLKSHFASTFLKNNIPAALGMILVLEIISGILCIMGPIQIMVNGLTEYGYYGAVCSSITLLFLLAGQRIAKDYDGARTIGIYFIPAVLAVFWLS
ncbi:DoxX family protein [Flavobacterium silvaticum]|uniref:DoxX family protein n=1 Tax=Flavobacterium silvaticum TaxID=1852020 RepID=A0A972JIM4_9FLAO|nr:DoxX family protein [Flavobacterium silvaticum]NMH28423.1 DoxX family protein [Flavobacterium silvaticum]